MTIKVVLRSFQIFIITSLEQYKDVVKTNDICGEKDNESVILY